MEESITFQQWVCDVELIDFVGTLIFSVVFSFLAGAALYGLTWVAPKAFRGTVRSRGWGYTGKEIAKNVGSVLLTIGGVALFGVCLAGLSWVVCWALRAWLCT